MKVSELFEAAAPLSQDKIDSKFIREMNRRLIRLTKASMKAGDVRWWMKSPQKLIIETDRSMRELITAEDAEEFGFDGLEGIKDFFKRHGLEPAKKPSEPKIVDRPIYD